MDWLEVLQAIIQLVWRSPGDKAVDLLTNALSWVQSEVSQALGVESQLAKLEDTRERICSLLHDADLCRSSVTEDRVLRWLGDLKDVALDSEDLLEEFKARLALLKQPGRGGKRKRGFPFFLRRRVAKEIAEIRDRYEAIDRDRKRLRLETREAPRRVLVSEAPPTGALTREGLRTLGRDGDRDQIVDLLLREGGAADGGHPALLHVVPIYGMAGLGKTTLARYVFNDGRIAARFKEKRIWVCATGGFNVVRITKEILQSLTRRACCLSNFTMLQRRVGEELGRVRIGRESEPFLLVLDDVGVDGLLYWEYLRACLPGDGVSRVLLTTRSDEVATKMGTLQHGRPTGLSDEDCSSLLQQRAFPDGNGLDLYPRLRDICRRIVIKCQGSPLAAISLGGLLSGKTDEAEWRSMLEETAAFTQQGGNVDVIQILKHAYELLPPHLKNCFAFCAVFPAGHQFDKDELVKLWMAEGFIERRGNRRLEAMGGRCLDELLWMSFFQTSGRGQHPQHCSKYEIPTLLHELSRSVSKHECCRMGGDAPQPHDVPERARHLALYSHNREPITFAGFREHRRLRTLVLQDESITAIGVQLPSNLFPKMARLRVLDLGNAGITALPDSIGELVLLRYLSLYNSPIERLPESVADLCNLQTLELGECYKLVELPQGTSSLTNLRHLGLRLDPQVPHRSSNLISMPSGIGKLTSLETLSRFAVGTGGSTTGGGLSEMKNLKLRGELWISKLENAVDLEDAREANLGDKHQIEALTLQWSGSDQTDDHLQHKDAGLDVIECLQPPAQIKYLCVDGYDGAAVPGWMGGSSFSELVTLRLSRCNRWESLPSLGRLPVLKELYIEGMQRIRTMDHLFPGGGVAERFPCVEKIRLWDLPCLERWSVVEGDMPRLSEVQICRCPKLIDLPWPPSSLIRIVKEDCEASPSPTQDSTESTITDE